MSRSTLLVLILSRALHLLVHGSLCQNSGHCNMKRLGILFSPPPPPPNLDGMPLHRWVTPSILSRCASIFRRPTHYHFCAERRTGRVMTLIRARTRTARSAVQRANENETKILKRPVKYLSRRVFVAWLDSESTPLNVDHVTRCSVAGDCKDLSDRNLHRLASLVTAWNVKVEVCSHVRAVLLECRSYLFCITTPHDMRLAKTRATFYPIKSKTKTNHNALAHVFPRFSVLF